MLLLPLASAGVPSAAAASDVLAAASDVLAAASDVRIPRALLASSRACTQGSVQAQGRWPRMHRQNCILSRKMRSVMVQAHIACGAP